MDAAAGELPRGEASATAWAARACGFTPYARHVFVFGLALAALALFIVGLIRDVRSFSNAVFLGLALALGALGAAEYLVGLPGHRARLVVLALVLLVVVGPAVAASYLLMNGITMVRREGLRLANLLPLVAGLAIIAVIALVIAAERVGSAKLSLFSAVAVLLFGYVSFLFASFAIYGFLYNRLALFRRADFVIVLGSGLADGSRVPPLLASRLERGRAVYERLAARGKGDDPVLIVSGGKGGDEQVSEAQAMAEYLIGRGFPASRVVLEDRSTNTEENIGFSKAIMEQSRPGARCVIVTSGYHALRAAVIARQAGVRGQVASARTAGYYQMSAMLREFAAMFLRYKVINFSVVALIVVLPVAYDAARLASW
jgi:uncharacterized SAM-binding protein YcdF (DUF218 family)